jgi:preprotein translocase subunit SecF
LKEAKSILSISLAVGMLIYAVPRLEIGQGFTAPTIFGIVWLCMSLIIIAAHLHHILKVDEETARELANVKKFKRWRTQQFIQRKMGALQGRKQ